MRAIFQFVLVSMLTCIFTTSLSATNGTRDASLTRADSPEGLIIAEDIVSAEACSAYGQYRFHMSVPCGSPVWKYILPLEDGTEITVASATGESFRTPSITQENTYGRNAEGLVPGKVRLECQKDGSPYTEEYVMMLDVEPRILDVKVLETEFLPDMYANYTIAVSYQGCVTLECLVEEELASYATSYISKEPDYTELRLTNVDIHGRAWLHLYAWNKYGGNNHEYDLPTKDDNPSGCENPAQSGDARIVRIMVYGSDGRLLRVLNDENELQGQAGQMLILKYIDDKGNVVGIRKKVSRL